MPEPAGREGDAELVARAEAWFRQGGLPWFVDDVRDAVAARLRPARLLPVVLLAVVVAAGVGLLVGALGGSVPFGISSGLTAVGVLLAGYALVALGTHPIASWALRRAFGSLGLLVPLATRALPMLLLFITFLFINTEVWQVASALQGGVLWGALLFFAAAAVGFMVPQLARELDEFDDAVGAEQVLAATRDTPLAQSAEQVLAAGVDLPAEAQVTGLQMVNLVLVLVIAQAVQVLLLALAVFCFFMVFGAVAIEPSVIEAWLGAQGHPQPLFGLDFVSVELLHVSIFLAAFSGLYFAVVAITDELYRKEFFGQIMDELARVVGARVVYRALRRGPA